MALALAWFLVFALPLLIALGAGWFYRPLEALAPEISKPVGCHLGVSDRVLDVLVAEVVLQGPRVVAIVGELEPTGVAKRTAEPMPSACRWS